MSKHILWPPQLAPEPGSTVFRPARHTTPELAPRRGRGTARGSARALALGLATTMTLSTAGCLGPARPSPEDTAIALGSAISSLDFGAVPLTAEASTAPGAVRDALPEQLRSNQARPTVTTDAVTVQADPAPAEGITAEEAQALRQMMAGTVTESTATMLQDVPGAPVLAKTGTAQFVAEGEDLAHTWLIAIHGDLAVALFFNEGQGGGVDNGPVMRDFLTAVEEIVPSE